MTRVSRFPIPRLQDITTAENMVEEQTSNVQVMLGTAERWNVLSLFSGDVVRCKIKHATCWSGLLLEEGWTLAAKGEVHPFRVPRSQIQD